MSKQEIRPAIAAAEASVAAQAPLVAHDPNRPIYHFRPPAYWMNDPNGTIYHNGYYHVFYQFNPYADFSHDIHWGHTRSKDLVHWEQLPVAIPPSYDLDESGVWSGCMAINEEGRPVAFYTSVGVGRKRPFQQRATVGDDDLLTWQPHPRTRSWPWVKKACPALNRVGATVHLSHRRSHLPRARRSRRRQRPCRALRGRGRQPCQLALPRPHLHAAAQRDDLL